MWLLSRQCNTLMHSLVWKQPMTRFTNTYQTPALRQPSFISLHVLANTKANKSLWLLIQWRYQMHFLFLNSSIWFSNWPWWTFSLLSAGTMWLNLELRESYEQHLQPGPNSCLGNSVNLHCSLLVARGHPWLNMKHKLSLASHVHNKPLSLIVKVKHLGYICALGPYSTCSLCTHWINNNPFFFFVRTNMLFRF